MFGADNVDMFSTAAALPLNKVRFDTSNQALQQELKAAVDGYFARSGQGRGANAAMYRKAAILVVSWIFLQALLVSGVLPAIVAWPLCLLMGVVMAVTGFNIGHDAIHGAFSNKAWINALGARVFDLAGASSFTWSTAHNFVHHTYTNVPGVDHDLDPGPFMVFVEQERPAWIYRFQHVYSFALYFMTHVVWVFKKDFQQLAAPDPRTNARAPIGKIVDVIAGKLVHFALFLALPLLVSGYAPWQVVVGYFTAIAAAGLTLAVVFQLAHVVEGTAFPRVNAQGRIDDSWAAHQLKTTTNFAADSVFWNFFTGGLNHQVEHHLFYKIAHIHYPALAPLVREVARRHELPYLEFPTFGAALLSHIRTMRRFGLGTIEAKARGLVGDDVITMVDPQPAE